MNVEWLKCVNLELECECVSKYFSILSEIKGAEVGWRGEKMHKTSSLDLFSWVIKRPKHSYSNRVKTLNIQIFSISADFCHCRHPRCVLASWADERLQWRLHFSVSPSVSTRNSSRFLTPILLYDIFGPGTACYAGPGGGLPCMLIFSAVKEKALFV